MSSTWTIQFNSVGYIREIEHMSDGEEKGSRWTQQSTPQYLVEVE
jgi:hypothetical protein